MFELIKNNNRLNSTFDNIFNNMLNEFYTPSNNINYIDVYPQFIGKNKRESILDTFIFGDLHWNIKGTKIIFDKLINEIF